MRADLMCTRTRTMRVCDLSRLSSMGFELKFVPPYHTRAGVAEFAPLSIDKETQS
jgi:hypothetical protein